MLFRSFARFTSLGLVGVFALGACGGDSATSAGGENGTATDPIVHPIGLLNVGDLLSLNVNVTDACTNPVYHAARVVAVGTKSIIFADTLNPKNGFTTADFQRFAARFDTLVYPLDVSNFGDPTDIDKNGRVAIVFTLAVNQLTPANSGQYVGGLAYSRDLFPKIGNAGGRASTCAASNEGEYFYAMTPDPTGQVNGNQRTTGFVDSNTTAVLAHELQHIINSSRRLYVNNAPGFEEKWLDEGLAHIAEELLFYKEAGLTSRQNLDITALRSTNAIRSAYNLEMTGNATRLRTFLIAPALNSPYAANDSLPTRGGAWSWIRYSVDRVNATDGFVAGNGQVASAPGTLTLTPGATAGDYVATVVNTSLQSVGTATFNLAATSASGDIIPVQPAVPAYLRAVANEGGNGPVRDEAFEARIRTRERAELTPLMSSARAWYASRVAAHDVVQPSRSLSVSSLTDADGNLFFKLVNSTTTGITNFQTIVGNDAAGFIRDWSVSNAIDDVAALNTQYQQRSWNWHSIYPATFQSGAYPLFIPTTSVNSISTGTIVGGGSLYYKYSVSANGSATLNITAPGGAANPNLQIIVVRTK